MSTDICLEVAMRLLCSLTLLSLFSLTVWADNTRPQPVFSPEVAETNYMLEQVEKLGDKSNEYDRYTRECNTGGICRMTLRPAGTVVYDTAFGRQTVIYPDRNTGGN